MCCHDCTAAPKKFKTSLLKFDSPTVAKKQFNFDNLTGFDLPPWNAPSIAEAGD